MSNIAAVSANQAPLELQAATAGPSLMSKLTERVSVAAALESSASDSLDKIESDEGASAAALLQLQLQTANLSTGTLASAQLISSLTDTLKKVGEAL